MIVKFVWNSSRPYSESRPVAEMSCKELSEALRLDVIHGLGHELSTQPRRDFLERMRVEQGELGMNDLWVGFFGDEVFVSQRLDDEPGYLVMKETEFYRLLDDFKQYKEAGRGPDEQREYPVERVVRSVPLPHAEGT